MGSVDIRLCLIGDRKHRSESSLASAKVARRMHDGGRSSCPMIVKRGAKEARECEEQLHQRNRRMAG
jgi:hypothetical protein